jgi:hypothetical protein
MLKSATKFIRPFHSPEPAIAAVFCVEGMTGREIHGDRVGDN